MKIRTISPEQFLDGSVFQEEIHAARDRLRAQKRLARLAPELLAALNNLYLVGLGSNADAEGDESARAAMARAAKVIAKAEGRPE